MRLIHVSDLHIGFRQFARQAAGGLNQREVDVALSFRSAISRTIELKPDLIVIGGDIFHTVRPGNPSILHAYKEFARLVAELPETEIVMVAGNHDQPRLDETGCILGLFGSLGFKIAIDKVERFNLRGGEIAVLAVPDRIFPRPTFERDPSAKYNVLLLHGEIAGMIKRAQTPAEAEHDVQLEELSDGWDYIALGHYHCYRQMADRAFYSGSIDYTSSDIWREVREEQAAGIAGKGIVEFDLETGERTFHEIRRSRKVIDLPAIDARGKTSAEVSALVLEQAESVDGGIDDQIVRQTVVNIEKHVIRDLDHRMIRDLKRRALHFNLDSRRPDEALIARGEAPRQRKPLKDLVREMLEARELTPGIDRDALVALGLSYLAQAEENEAAKSEPTEAAA